jgi:hypothetical protein
VRPVWSADGRYLLVSTTQKLRNEDGTISVNDQVVPNTEIAIVGRDGTGFTILTDNPSPDIAMAWDAGGWVYFTSRREQTFDIWRFKPQLVETASR